MSVNAIRTKLVSAIPWALGIVSASVFAVWLLRAPRPNIIPRRPVPDQAGEATASGTNHFLHAARLIPSNGVPANLAGAWPQFRGPNRDGISPEMTSLAHRWDASIPRELWSVEVGEGYAGAAVSNGRVYLMDYDRENKQDALRCLSLGDGKEIWRLVYPLSVKRNHGMSRAVPAVTGRYAVAMGPKCHVTCVDSASGEVRWGVDLVRQFGAKVPPWYSGQCPLIDGTNVILAVGGPRALLAAIDLQTGQTVWTSPNPRAWQMTHSSIMPMQLGEERLYLYCGNQGVAGISARTGSIAWENHDWKISIATVPSPLVLPEGRIFLSGGYDAGSLMLRLKPGGGPMVAETLFKLEASKFGATQQTPVFYNSHIWGIRPDGQMVCLDLDGNIVWTSGPKLQFGLGPFVVASGLIYALNDSGKLTLLEMSGEGCHLVGQIQALQGRESWGPMALAGGRLILRNLTRLVCLDIAGR